MAKDSPKTKRWEKIKAGLKTAGKIFVYCAVPMLLIAGLVASAILCLPAFIGILLGLVAWGAILHYRDKRRQERSFAHASKNQNFDSSEKKDAHPLHHITSAPPSMITTVKKPSAPTDADQRLSLIQQSQSSAADASGQKLGLDN